MRKVILTMLIALGFALGATAQDRTITGKVTDDKGVGLKGISITVQGTKNGTSTNSEGNFSIKAAGSNTLVFSGVDFQTQKLRANSDKLSVQMVSKANPLEEIIVTGYQSRRKRDDAGAISSVKASQIENLPSVSLDKALQGKAAGVLVQSNNGIPGGSINVRIRGAASINGGNDPLYVVDGVQINTRSDGAFTQNNPLAFLNPDDIESIDILKDAASSAIYGSSASNGVVIVTTKKGRSGKTKFTVSSSFGMVTPLKKFEVLDAQEFYQWRAEAVGYANNLPANNLAVKQNVLTLLRVAGASTLTSTQADSAAASLQTYDWQNAAFRKGLIKTLNVSASGGNDRSTFRVSASAENQETFVTKANFNRYGLKVDLTNKATEKLSFNTSVNLSTFYQNNPFATNGSFLGSPAFSAAGIIPTNPIKNPDGSYYGVPGAPIANLAGTLNQNIIAVNEWRSGFTRTNQMVGGQGIDYKLNSWLTARGFAGLDYRLVQGKNVTDARTPDGFNRKGLVQVQSNWNTNIIANATLNAVKQFGTKNKFDGLFGYEYRRENNESLTASGDGFPTYEFATLNLAAAPVTVGEFKTGYKKASLFGNLNYSFDGKYLFGIVVRYDGSSKFGPNNKFGTFGGGKIGWNVDKESFLRNSKIISQLRLRYSYGTVGDDQIGNFDGSGLFGSGGLYNGAAGIGFNNLENPDLKWETVKTSNFGVDLGLFDNRITTSVEFYLKKTTDLLLSQPLQQTTGFASFTSNVGALQNKGIEITLNADVVKSNINKGFGWNVNFVFSQNEQKVTELYGGLTQISDNDPNRPNSGVLVHKVGYPTSSLFTQRYAGVNSATGRPQWYDDAGNLTYQIANKDRVILGSTQLPKYAGGFTNRFSFKGFSLDAFFNYEYGRYATDGQLNFNSENIARINSIQSNYDSRWTTPGQITATPRPNANGAESKGSGAQGGDRTWFKADFIRLKTLTFTYDAPSSLFKGSRMGVSSLRAYVQGTNLYTYSASEGYDVEFVGVATGIIPQSRIITAGLQIGF
jgi:TonB-dependent starch-binding outer membrane protein SusC